MKSFSSDENLSVKTVANSNKQLVVGTVISDQETPTFETVRIKLKAGQDLKPGTLVRVPVMRNEQTILIGRIRSAYECNPNERVESVGVRDALKIPKMHPTEEHSTRIFRLAEADLIEEIFNREFVENGEKKIKTETRAPQNLPNSGADVFIADVNEIVQTLGLEQDENQGLFIGETTSGTISKIILKRQSIQRHFFICGTTGSGKSYAMGVITEELVQKHKLPVVFIDTQDEYSELVKKLGGVVVEPGKDFSIRISSLTESELLDLLPEAMKKSPLQCDIVAKAFGELQTKLTNEDMAKFTLDDVLAKIPEVSAELTAKEGDIRRVIDAVQRRLGTLAKLKIFGHGVADWRKFLYPCVTINCKKLTSSQLQSVATAVLRELQNLRLRNHIPPYVAVIDEAHLFVPEGTSSPCKQIIREGVRIGRHHGICMVLLTQSPVDIDKSTIRQCNTRLVFALEPDQLDAIKGVKADATDEMLRALPKMPQGTCLLSGTYESVKHTIPVRIRKRNTEDSEGGKTPNIFEEMQEKWIKIIEELKTEGGE
ncbi:ATP-binding protein [Gloeomargaritales cyanobacterium VI4D9]|nr:ATP-binding protein [Gloeomargaritales cyanobacterium VI4D9]